jgi:tyrosyl-tRNA synthetase
VAAEVPTTVIGHDQLDDVFGLLASAGVVASTSDARRTIAQKGIKVNGAVLEEGQTLAAHGVLHDKWVLVRKGKTTYHLFEVAR